MRHDPDTRPEGRPTGPSRPVRFAAEPDTEEVSARIFGWLWLAGAASSWSTLAVPGLPVGSRPAILAAAVVTTLAAVASLGVARRPRAAAYVAPLTLLLGLPLGAIVIALTGGAESAGRFTLVFGVVFAAWGFRPRAALGWVVLTLVVYAAPLAYSDGASASRFLAELIVVAPTYLALAAGVFSAKRLLIELRRRAERLADEQGAQRRVATAVTEGATADTVHALVAEETARLLDAAGAVVVRAGREGANVTGAWGAMHAEPGVSAVGESVETVAQRALGGGPALVAPVLVEGRVWGGLAAPRATDDLAPDALRRLRELGELLGLAVANLEARDLLAVQALTDPLTGLANRRSLHDRLELEARRLDRRGGPLSLAVIDCDGLKAVNDRGGHEAGDRLLVALATGLREVARGEDLVARMGGDEFAWLLPQTGAGTALEAIERLRRGLSSAADGEDRPSFSAGVANLESGEGPDELIRRADRALYAAKEGGRGLAHVGAPVREVPRR